MKQVFTKNLDVFFYSWIHIFFINIYKAGVRTHTSIIN